MQREHGFLLQSNNKRLFSPFLLESLITGIKKIQQLVFSKMRSEAKIAGTETRPVGSASIVSNLATWECTQMKCYPFNGNHLVFKGCECASPLSISKGKERNPREVISKLYKFSQILIAEMQITHFPHKNELLKILNKYHYL